MYLVKNCKELAERLRKRNGSKQETVLRPSNEAKIKHFDCHFQSFTDEERSLFVHNLVSTIKGNINEPIQYRVVFDLDQVLIDRLPLNSISCITEHYIEHHYPGMTLFSMLEDIYLFYPNFDLVILTILSWKGWSVEFFSAGGELRNKCFIEQILFDCLTEEHETTTILTLEQLQTSGRVQIRSRADILDYTQQGKETTEWTRIKDLRLFLEVGTCCTDNIVIIDDSHAVVHTSQMPYIHIPSDPNIYTCRTLLMHNIVQEIVKVEKMVQNFELESIEGDLVYSEIETFIHTCDNQLRREGWYLWQVDTNASYAEVIMKEIDAEDYVLNVTVEMLAWRIHCCHEESITKWFSPILHASYCLGILQQCKTLLEPPLQPSLRKALEFVLQRPDLEIQLSTQSEIQSVFRNLSTYKTLFHSRPIQTKDQVLYNQYSDWVRLGNDTLRSLVHNSK